MTLRRYAPALVYTCLALCTGCREDPLTQLVVVVDSDWDGVRRVDIEVDGFEDDVVARTRPRPGRALLPQRLVLVHDGGKLGPIHVTARAFADDGDDPVLVEPRRGLFFERGKTLMLKIDLLRECIDRCEGRACLAGPLCVDPDDERATGLVPWNGKVDAIDIVHHGPLDDAGQDRDATAPGADASPDDGGGERDGGDDAAAGDPDAADATPPPAGFPYAPSNFDPLSEEIAGAAREDIVFDCGTSRFDSTSLEFTGSCAGPEPAKVVIEQSGGGDAVVLVTGALEIAAGSTLELTGERPVILAVFGDARIEGAIDASARGVTPGPGAGRDCAAGTGSAGSESDFGDGAGGGGGGGGGFGSAGGGGGPAGLSSSSTATSVPAAAGQAEPGSGLEPLRGGCPGGAGGDGLGAGGAGGGGGGAVQVSVAGELSLSGSIRAGGGGGAAGTSSLSGGGGGGSGGAIALEAATFQIADEAVLSANGGAGGAGQSGSPDDAAGSAGEDGPGSSAAAAGGVPEGSGGGGGDGAAAAVAAEPGSAGGGATYGYGGGGGGGGVGRIRARGVTSCLVPGVWSPRPVLECSDCGSCSASLPSDCQPYEHDSRVYYRCADARSWDEARASCESAGLQLIRVDDETENDALAAGTTETTWIGASDQQTEGDWRWTDGTAFWSGTSSGAAVSSRYEAWESSQPAQPDNLSGIGVTNADCGVVDADGAWADRGCSGPHPYVCEP